MIGTSFCLIVWLVAFVANAMDLVPTVHKLITLICCGLCIAGCIGLIICQQPANIILVICAVIEAIALTMQFLLSK